jgi:hypothetical protein
MKRVLILLALVGVVLAGCSGDKKADQTQTGGQPAAQNASTPAATPPAAAPAETPAAQPATQQTPPAEAKPVESKPKPQPPKPAPAKAEPKKPAEPVMITRLVPIPSGTELAAALDEQISTETHQAGRNFTATLKEPFSRNGVTLLPAGTKVAGSVTASKRAGRVGGKAEMTIEFTELTTPDGKSYKLNAQPVSLEGKSTAGGDVGKVLGGAVAGAIGGGLLGGKKNVGKGAAVGGAAGAAWAVATRGGDIVLDSGSPVSVTLSREVEVPVTMREDQPNP